MRNWWRWTLRGMAVVALVIGGVLLFIQPIANETLHIPGYNKVVTVGCSSPFEQFQGKVLQTPSLQPIAEIAAPDTYPSRCKGAASDREHIIEALGIGAVILIALSFWRRRRPVVIVPVNPSVL